jgi:MFS family permease
VVGPLLASLFLLFYPGEYRKLFALTLVPGAIAVLLIWFVPEEEQVRLKPGTAGSLGPREDDLSAVSPFRLRVKLRRTAVASAEAVSRTHTRPTRTEPLPGQFGAFMLVLALFTLGNSTDAFLLLKLTEVAGSARFVPLMWAALHVVKATVSVVGGHWSDSIGRRAVIAIGWLVYAAVYAGFAASTSLSALLMWFLVYGFYFGFTEGTEKALVADLAPASRRGFAFGVYNAVQGIGALTASVAFGVIWKAYGPPAAFGTGAALALLATALLFVAVGDRGQRPIFRGPRLI